MTCLELCKIYRALTQWSVLGCTKWINFGNAKAEVFSHYYRNSSPCSLILNLFGSICQTLQRYLRLQACFIQKYTLSYKFRLYASLASVRTSNFIVRTLQKFTFLHTFHRHFNRKHIFPTQLAATWFACELIFETDFFHKLQQQTSSLSSKNFHTSPEIFNLYTRFSHLFQTKRLVFNKLNLHVSPISS